MRAYMNPDERETLPCYGIYNAGGEEGFASADVLERIQAEDTAEPVKDILTYTL